MHIALVVNYERDNDGVISQYGAALLREKGAYVDIYDDASRIGKEYSLIITFGGDGTLLRASKQACIYGIPVLGINIGHLGYLTELEKDEIHLLPQVLQEPLVLEPRMMLSVQLLRGGKDILSDIALNDIVVSHGEIMRVIPLTLFCDRTEVKEFRGDGLIACTPTGSTAYSMAAGGPIVDSSADSITLTPVSAHALYAKSFVFSKNRTIDIEVGALENRSAFMSVDGREAVELMSDDIVRVCRSTYQLQLVKLKTESFFSILNRKL